MAAISGSSAEMAMCKTSAPFATTKCCLLSSSRSSSSSLRFSRLSFSPPHHSRSGSRRRKLVVSLATEDPFDAKRVVDDALKNVQEVWAKTEDKVALGSLAFTAFLTLWASTGIINAVDRLPLLPSVLELVGVSYSAWFAYRYLLFKPDREAFLKKVKDTWHKITGSTDNTL